MKRIQKGFTLIELMIVVAIIGILAAVAIPAYQDYVVKAKLSKVTSTIDPLKLALVQYYQENGSFPSTPTANALPAATAAPGDVWYSLGLAFTPTVPGELQQISLDNGGVITLHFAAAGIKTGIDGTYIGITPIAGGTGVQFFYSTSATDTNSINLLKKSFINAGIAAPATLPSLAGTAL